MPGAGVEFSGPMGATIKEAGAGVPHGSLRATTAGAIRAAGGIVEYAPEPIAGEGSPLNYNHVNVTLGSDDPFGAIEANPAPKAGRLAPDELGAPPCRPADLLVERNSFRWPRPCRGGLLITLVDRWTRYLLP